jgi:hypothetical protein
MKVPARFRHHRSFKREGWSFIGKHLTLARNPQIGGHPKGAHMSRGPGIWQRKILDALKTREYICLWDILPRGYGRR